MKVVILSGSPHRHGTSAALVDRFEKGAKEAGHQVHRFDAAFMDIHPCLACEKCHTEGACVWKDDMDKVSEELLEADVVVLASPIYYYSICAQLKMVIDRFYANDKALHGNKKVMLITTMADELMESADAAITMVKNAAKYLQWEVIGGLHAKGCFTVSDLEGTDYVDAAYSLGKGL